MMRLDLPFWLNGVQLSKLKAAAQSWWNNAENWLHWPLDQLDADTCHLTVLDLLAWQRDITRYHEEPERLYRRRVKFAFINAVDAGSTAGLKRILQRLGVGYVEIEERLPERDWDVVVLKLSDSQLSDNPQLLRVITQQYGRTCRRYDFLNFTAVTLLTAVAEFNDDQQTLIAHIKERP